MKRRLVERSIRDLESAGANFRCKDLIKLLSSLGFDVRDGKKQGHMVVTHANVSRFSATSFTCGHGSNPEIKRVYIKNILRLLREYESDLKEFLGEKK